MSPPWGFQGSCLWAVLFMCLQFSLWEPMCPPGTVNMHYFVGNWKFLSSVFDKYFFFHSFITSVFFHSFICHLLCLLSFIHSSPPLSPPPRFPSSLSLHHILLLFVLLLLFLLPPPPPPIPAPSPSSSSFASSFNFHPVEHELSGFWSQWSWVQVHLWAASPPLVISNMTVHKCMRLC